MNLKLNAILFLTLAFISSEALATPSVYGAGTNSCGEWVEARKGGDWYSMGQWMLGFVSAATYEGRNLRDTKSVSLALWMDNYCQSHPLDIIAEATVKLVVELEN